MNILFADDMEINRFLVSSVLKNCGHNIETLTDGDELLERLASGQRPDLVITDNNMIRVDGLDVLWRIRKDDRYEGLKSLPIIVYTDSERAKTEIEALGGILVNKVVDELVAAVDAIAYKIEKE